MRVEQERERIKVYITPEIYSFLGLSPVSLLLLVCALEKSELMCCASIKIN